MVTSDAFSQEKRDHQAALGARIALVQSDRQQITEQLIKSMIEMARRISAETGAWWWISSTTTTRRRAMSPSVR